MYQRTQAQSDFPVENAKNLLKEINEEYNVRAVSYGTTQNALTCQCLNTTICLTLQTIGIVICVHYLLLRTLSSVPILMKQINL